MAPFGDSDSVYLVLARLGAGPDRDLVDVDVRGPGRDPGDRGGDVVRRQWIGHSRVDRVSAGRVTTEPDQSELLGRDHPRRDLGDPDGLAEKFQAQGPG